MTGTDRTRRRAEAETWEVAGVLLWRTLKAKLWGLTLNLQFSGFQSKLQGTSRGASHPKRVKWR